MPLSWNEISDRALMGSEELINGIPRYCLWLVDCPPDELRRMPYVLTRVEAVKGMRLQSRKKQQTAIATAAQGVLDARAHFPSATLADLYDPLTMPPELVKAHQTLDRVVDAA